MYYFVIILLNSKRKKGGLMKNFNLSSLRKKYKIIEKIEKICINIENDNISAYSAQCAYYTILSFIPFIILLITLIQYTSIDQITLINAISKIIPSSMNEFVLGIVKEVYSKSLGTISISIIFTLWSAGKGLLALIKGLHCVYSITDKKKNSAIYLKIASIIQTVIFIFLIVIALILLVFGNSLISIVKNYFGALENFSILSVIFAKIGFIFITFIVFLFLYKYMPKHKVRFRDQIMGAVFGAISLNVISLIFSKYLDIFKGFSITYGSLTTLILVMMWTYACFYTIFLGAEINITK